MSRTHFYARSSGIQILDALRVQGKRIFTTTEAQEIASDLAITPATLHWALHELTRSGWIRRLRRGLYAIDETERGGPAPHPFAIATALVEPSAISHWSALAYHGLTEQIPHAVTASTPRDIVTPRMRLHTQDADASTWDVGGLSVRYIRVKPERFWGIERVWIDEFSRIPITDRERTILDGFLSPRIFGSIDEIFGILEEHIREIDITRLVDYTLRYEQDAAIKRVGYILDQFDVPPEALRPLKEALKPGYRLLDPQKPNRGAYVRDWQIRLNADTG